MLARTTHTAFAGGLMAAKMLSRNGIPRVASGEHPQVKTWHETAFPFAFFPKARLPPLREKGGWRFLTSSTRVRETTNCTDSWKKKRRSCLGSVRNCGSTRDYSATDQNLNASSAMFARRLNLSQTEHTDVLKAYKQALRQGEEIDTTVDQLSLLRGKIETFSNDLLLDDWPRGVFDAIDNSEVLGWRVDVDRELDLVRDELTSIASQLQNKINSFRGDSRLSEWRKRVDRAKSDHAELQETLARQGISDPQAFGNLMQEQNHLKSELKHLDKILESRDALIGESALQAKHIRHTRKAITLRREDFLKSTLADNDYVRMKIIEFGLDEQMIEQSIRTLLDIQDRRFEADILEFEDGEPVKGMAFDLARSNNREDAVEAAKSDLCSASNRFSGAFSNHLKKKLENQEFADRIECWFPEDDLQIEYSRTGDASNWSSISQGSQGQRSAALLAFFLAFGDEPLILDQPEDDLDNQLIYQLIVRQIRENKLRRQLIVVTHNPNVVVNGDADMIHALEFKSGQCRVSVCGALQESEVREKVCQIMEGGRAALQRRWARLGRGG